MNYEIKSGSMIIISISEEVSFSISYENDVEVTQEQIIKAYEVYTELYVPVIELMAQYDGFIKVKCIDEDNNIVWETEIQLSE